METKLIEAVRMHEVLYNKCLLGDKKLKRAAAWSSIAKKLNMPEFVCKSRWKNLRDRFVKKHTKNYASGSSAEIEEKQWPYYQQMEFLREHITPRKLIASLNSQQPLNEQARIKTNISIDQKPTILNNIEMENNEIGNQSVSVSSSASNSEKILKKDPLGTNKFKCLKNLNKDIDSRKNLVDANDIFCERKPIKQNINHRDEEQLLNFFRSCIDDILMLDKQKQLSFKKGILDLIEELQGV